MTKTAKAVLDEALGLSEAERAAVAGALLESLESAPDSQVEEAWRGEVARRVADLDAGRVETIPWDTVRDRLLARLGAAGKV